MLSSLSKMKSCSGYKVHEGDKREFIHRILICISPTLSNAKSIKSFLQGSVLSQLIFPICIGHELLALLSSPYLLKRCQYFCAWFFPCWRKYAQGQRLPSVSTFPSDEKSIIFKWEASSQWWVCHQEVVICCHSPRQPPVVRAGWRNAKEVPTRSFSKDQDGHRGGTSESATSAHLHFAGLPKPCFQNKWVWSQQKRVKSPRSFTWRKRGDQAKEWEMLTEAQDKTLRRQPRGALARISTLDKDNTIPLFQNLRSRILWVLPTKCQQQFKGCIAPCCWTLVSQDQDWDLPQSDDPFSFPQFCPWSSLRTATFSMDEAKGMSNAKGF